MGAVVIMQSNPSGAITCWGDCKISPKKAYEFTTTWNKSVFLLGLAGSHFHTAEMDP